MTNSTQTPRVLPTTCKRCPAELPPIEFLENGRMKPRMTLCRACRTEDQRARREAGKVKPLSLEMRRAHRLRYRYNISKEQYDEMFRAQGGVCASCGEESPTRALDVDHDHACCPGERSCGACVRALLCRGCNWTVGVIENGRFAVAQVYLEGWK